METYAIEPEELATALQRRFQSSASVAKLPGKAADTGKEIALQVSAPFPCRFAPLPLRAFPHHLIAAWNAYARSSDTHISNSTAVGKVGTS